MFPVARNCLVLRRKLTSGNVRSFQKCWEPHSLMGGKRSEDLAISRSRTTGFLSMHIGIGEGLTSLLVSWPLRYRAGSRFLRSAEQTPRRARVNRRSPPELGASENGQKLLLAFKRKSKRSGPRTANLLVVS